MKNLLALGTFLILNTVNAQQISSDFSIDAEDWIVIGDATSALPFYLSEGGNTAGYISADDTAAGGVWYWSAPAKFLGDQNTSFGKTLSFDLKQNSLSSQFDDNDIIITSPEITIVLDLPNNPDIEWTSYNVTLDATFPWKIDNIISGELATSEQIATVLSNITSLKIRGEYVSGADTGGLDNVILENNLLGIDSSSISNLSFYPNPATNEIYFSKNLEQIAIYDFQGKKINITKTANSADISALPQGFYIIKGLDINGKSVTQKIVKE